MNITAIKALFLDIGGVLLTKGWGRDARRRAAERFGLDYDDLSERHALVSHLYEEGRITLDEYLKRVVFYAERGFTGDEFKAFIFEQSQPLPDMLGFVGELKAQYGLRAVALSNEGREIADYRIRTFDLTSLLDFFVCSCYAGTLKPDPAIYCLALDQAQIPREQVVYIDDTLLHVEVACELGIPSIHHTHCESTRAELARMGLKLTEHSRSAMG